MTNCHISQLTPRHHIRRLPGRLSNPGQLVTLRLVKKRSEKWEYRFDLADRLKQMRKASGFEEPADLAVELGIPAATYRRYENTTSTKDNREFPRHLIPRLCEVTGYSCWYVLTGQLTEPKFQHPKRS